MKKREKRFCVDLPIQMHKQVWQLSGYMKINILAQCLLVEYMTDPDLQEKVKSRINSK